jgi:DNA-binding IclR family transcriptional regulator
MAGNCYESGRTVSSKVINILLLFAQGGDYSLSEIARHTRLPVSTAHRLVTELVAADMLARTEYGHFHAGPNVKTISDHADPEPSSIQERVRRILEDLSAAVPATVRLGILRNRAVCYIERLPGIHPTPGFCEYATAPAHASAMGKALLAFACPAVVDDVVSDGLPAFTPATVTSPEMLRRALAIIRLTGIALCRREFQPAVSSIAVPVVGAEHTVVAALELQIRDGQALHWMRAPLVVAARALSREMLTTLDGRYLDIGLDSEPDGTPNMTVDRRPIGTAGLIGYN